MIELNEKSKPLKLKFGVQEIEFKFDNKEKVVVGTENDNSFHFNCRSEEKTNHLFLAPKKTYNVLDAVYTKGKDLIVFINCKLDGNFVELKYENQKNEEIAFDQYFLNFFNVSEKQAKDQIGKLYIYF